jgi:hypothetical protein
MILSNIAYNFYSTATGPRSIVFTHHVASTHNSQLYIPSSLLQLGGFLPIYSFTGPSPIICSSVPILDVRVLLPSNGHIANSFPLHYYCDLNSPIAGTYTATPHISLPVYSNTQDSTPLAIISTNITTTFTLLDSDNNLPELASKFESVDDLA